MMVDMLLDEQVFEVLKGVDDPELTDVSVYDLGMVHAVSVNEADVHVTMVPTFAGCPALHIIEKHVQEAVEELDWVESCSVEFAFDVLWTTEMINERGRQQLKKLGIAPPPKDFVEGEEWTVECPYCKSDYTSIENIFGPTACRSIVYCKSCRNPFEAMKPVLEQEIAR